MLHLHPTVTILVLATLLLSACQPIVAPEPQAAAPAFHTEIFATGAPLHGTNGIYFGPDGNLYIGCIGAQQIVVIDPESGEVIKRLGAEVGVTSPDDLVFGPDGSLYWTNLMTGEVVRLAPDGTVTKQQIALGVNPITFSDDGRLFVALDFMGDALYELDPELVAPPRLLAEKLGFLNAFDFGPDGYLYGPIYTQGKFVRIDVDADPVTIETVADGFATPVAAKFNPEGELYVLDQARGEVVHIDMETGEKTVIAKLPVGLDNLAFTPDGRLFVSHNDQGYIFEVNADGTARTVIQGGMAASSGVAVLMQDGVETIWVASIFSLNDFDAQSGQPGGFVEHNAMTVAADGENLVLSSWFANVVEIWNPATGEAIATYHDFAVPINAMRFQGDLIVAELGTASVVRVNGADPTQRTPLITNMAVPAGLAATADDLWVGDFATGQVLQLVAEGKPLAEPRTVATGLAAPEGLAATADGRLLVVESGAQRLSAIDLATGQVTPIAEGLALGAPGWPTMPPTGTFSGVALDAAGTIYVTGDIDNVLYRIVPPTSITASRTHHFRYIRAE
jgi:sugar lactone lactonase YvrE